jgi:SAM-dependent methyltransferase
MNHADSPGEESVRPPHPLALALIERLRSRPGALVLEVGGGSGRNTAALEAAGYTVRGIDDGTDSCAAALSTHALLHGTPPSIAALLERIAARLERKAPLYTTFGSINDARYGEGERIEEHVFAPASGDERGVAHAFFDETRLRALLRERWTIESIEERAVDEIAGSWAHQERPLHGAMHWFVVARRQRDENG